MAIPPGLSVDVRPPATPSAAAPTVVVVHGAMDRAASFGRMARHLDDLEVVRYDRRGYGRSAAVGIGTLADHVDDLLAVVGDRAVTVFGHSIGGVVALVAAQRAPERVTSVLAYEAPTPWLDWWPGAPRVAPEDPAEEAEAFMRRAIGDRYWARLGARTRAERRAEGPALVADLDSLEGPAPFDPAAVSVPVLAACGSETTWWHERAARWLGDEVPDGQLVVVDGATHGVHLSHPTAAAHLVRRAVAAGPQGAASQR